MKWISVLGATLLGSCGSAEVDLSAITEMRGALVSGRAANFDVTSEVVVIWTGASGVDAGAAITRTGMTPLDFELDLNGDPPEVYADEIVDWSSPWQYAPPDVPIAVGHVLAVRSDALEDPDVLAQIAVTFQHDSVQGYLQKYGLVYLPEDVPADSNVERYLCGALPAGYHLMTGDLAAGGDAAECERWPGGSEDSGALWSKVANRIADDLSIELCEDEFLACSE